MDQMPHPSIHCGEAALSRYEQEMFNIEVCMNSHGGKNTVNQGGVKDAFMLIGVLPNELKRQASGRGQ